MSKEAYIKAFKRFESQTGKAGLDGTWNLSKSLPIGSPLSMTTPVAFLGMEAENSDFSVRCNGSHPTDQVLFLTWFWNCLNSSNAKPF